MIRISNYKLFDETRKKKLIEGEIMLKKMGYHEREETDRRNHSNIEEAIDDLKERRKKISTKKRNDQIIYREKQKEEEERESLMSNEETEQSRRSAESVGEIQFIDCDFDIYSFFFIFLN